MSLLTLWWVWIAAALVLPSARPAVVPPGTPDLDRDGFHLDGFRVFCRRCLSGFAVRFVSDSVLRFRGFCRFRRCRVFGGCAVSISRCGRIVSRRGL